VCSPFPTTLNTKHVPPPTSACLHFSRTTFVIISHVPPHASSEHYDLSLASSSEHFDLSLVSTLVLGTANSFLHPSSHDLEILMVHCPNLTSRQPLACLALHFQHDFGFQSSRPSAFIFPYFCERRVFEFQRWRLCWFLLALTLVLLVHSLFPPQHNYVAT
jgi:hypothetical protein